MAQPLTWRSIAAPNFGASNSLRIAGNRQMQEGIGAIAQLGEDGREIEIANAKRYEEDQLGLLMAQNAAQGLGTESQGVLEQGVASGMGGAALASLTKSVVDHEGVLLQRDDTKDGMVSRGHLRDLQNKKFGRELNRDVKKDQQFAKQYGLSVAQFNHQREQAKANFEQRGSEFTKSLELNKQKFNFTTASKEKDDRYRDKVFGFESELKTQQAETNKLQFGLTQDYNREVLKQSNDHFTVSSGISQQQANQSGASSTGGLILQQDALRYRKESDKTKATARAGEFYSTQGLNTQDKAQAQTNFETTAMVKAVKDKQVRQAKEYKAQAKAITDRRASSTKAASATHKRVEADTKILEDIITNPNVGIEQDETLVHIIGNANTMFATYSDINPRKYAQMLVDGKNSSNTWWGWLGDDAELNNLLDTSTPSLSKMKKLYDKYTATGSPPTGNTTQQSKIQGMMGVGGKQLPLK